MPRTAVVVGLTGNAAWFGGSMLAIGVAGIVATLGGFAGLGHPRSERFLRAAHRPVYTGWTAAGPRPVSDPAPVNGYTVP